MNWILIVSVFVVQVCTIETCEARGLGLGLGRKPGVKGSLQQGLDPRSDYNCYDHYGRAHVGDIPHPSDCRHYLSCTLTFDGFAVATVMPCTNSLQFHIETCRCEWPDASKCFQAGHDYYETNRLKCAERV